MKIAPFGVEQWMNKWETRCEINLAETCVTSLTIEELLRLAGKTQEMPGDLARMKMTYGDIPGSDALRAAVAALYADQSSDNVMITHGTIGANALIYQTLVSRGDKVVSITPTYQQHTSIPESIGAELHTLRLLVEDGYLPNLDRLEELVGTDTVIITLTNPNNPTGAVIDRAGLERIAEIAKASDAWVLCDEVYRGTEQVGEGPGVSIADVYAKGISTGSTSKAFSLAGLRLGWIVGPESLMHDVEIHRDYNTISVGLIDDYFATMALENVDAILERSRRITRENLAILDDWVQGERSISYVKPAGGTTALLRYALNMPSYELCEAVIRDTGVMLTPGSVMGMEGTLRIGFANETQALKDGLPRLSEWFSKQSA
ncbi:Capreomycidine synthase [Roseovarius albus]|uniref:Aminotransferase n=1 Tax=Roseovarius albus TaxID=1247867 RepID=A0A1X6Y5V0_9RHOB|nr:aminotransferase [Roseovarius albus]SLN10915.1 Capreomycidine synthase [Roseovarius albus]